MTLRAPQAVGSIALAVALVACSNAPAPPLEPAASTETSTLGMGSAAERRFRHTATLLADASVLVAGGIQTESDPPTPSSSAVLYVPGQLDFAPLPELTTPRYGHTATRLLDGSVLLAGGFDERGELSSAELYLPDPGAFEAVGDMTVARGNHLATLLPDGRVLMVDREGSEVEAYDPATREFVPLGARGAGERQVAILLPDGKVLLLGSEPGEQEVFDPSMNGFAPLEPGMLLPADLGEITAALRLANEQLGVFGTQSFVRMDPEQPCEAGKLLCDGRCVDTSSDADNCGTCGRTCGESQLCEGGECRCLPMFFNPCMEEEIFCSMLIGCAPTCVDPGTTRCGDRCVDLVGDRENCGACGNTCGEYEVCSGGRCVCTKQTCGSGCVDAYFDSDNCGGCGIACSGGRACWNGACGACPVGRTHCDTQCVELLRDPKNCGACGVECASGEPCTAGLCGGRCPDGQMLCSDGCKVVAADVTNCSSCGNFCGPDFTCWSGTCLLHGTQSQTQPPPFVTAGVAGGVWMTGNSTTYALTENDFQWSQRRILPMAPGLTAFGGPGHTATALPDGSVLVVGGSGTDGMARFHPSWETVESMPSPLLDFVTALLPDGRALALAADAQRPIFTVPHIAVTVVEMTPRVAAVQPTGDVLVVGTAFDGSLAVKLVSRYLENVTTLDVPLGIDASGVAMPDGTVVMAGAEGLEIIRSAGGGGGFELEEVPVELECSRPALARLSNGRVLVVGNLVAYELDLRSLELSRPATLKQPRCRGGIIVRPGGALIVGGARGNTGEGAASITVEAYDNATNTTEVQNLIGTTLLDVTTIPWFDRPLLFANSSPVPNPTGSGVYRLNEERAQFDVAPLPPARAPRLLADGSLFGSNASFPTRMSLGSSAIRDSFSTGPSLTMNTDVDFDDVFFDSGFPGSAPEGSTGSTQSSPTNVPIPVWFPADGGWPVVGTLQKVGSRVVYHVPRTPFPGLGLMFLSTNGTLTGYGPVVIEPSIDGTDCLEEGECASGFCVDGVCCDTACTGACVACSAAEKGEGEDGTCEPVVAGTIEDACDVDDPETCDQDGTCDGRGECAMYPDGTECQPGYECSNSACVLLPTGEGGTGPGPGNDGGTGNEDPVCDGDNRINSDGDIDDECHPYRCPLGNPRCLESCTSNRDCVGGYSCSASGKCEKALNVTRLEGCGCRLESRDQRGLSAWALGLSAFFWLARRGCARLRGVAQCPRSLCAELGSEIEPHGRLAEAPPPERCRHRHARFGALTKASDKR